MKANVITISIPTPPCKKDCPYCISNMTFSEGNNIEAFLHNLPIIRRLAERLGISHCLITSKGEPLDNMYMVTAVITEFKYFPIEIQTNGLDLKRLTNSDLCEYCKVLAISVDHPNQLNNKLFTDDIMNQDWIVRASVVLTNNFTGWKLVDFITKCKKLSIQQLTIRVPSIPKKLENTAIAHKTARWIRDHVHNISFRQIEYDLKQLESIGQAHFIRDLRFGAKVYDVMGIGFTVMEYCIEEQNSETIRSLIYQSNGHLYTTWNSPGSILF